WLLQVTTTPFLSPALKNNTSKLTTLLNLESSALTNSTTDSIDILTPTAASATVLSKVPLKIQTTTTPTIPSPKLDAPTFKLTPTLKKVEFPLSNLLLH